MDGVICLVRARFRALIKSALNQCCVSRRLALSTDTVQVAAPDQAGQGFARQVQVTIE